jgi:hypothetical protein
MSSFSFPATYAARCPEPRFIYVTDAALIGTVSRTTRGIRVEGRIARTGIQEYLGDKGIVREYRPEATVFNADSLRTLAGAPATVLHPAGGRVTADNLLRLAVGVVASGWRRVGDFVEADLLITDRNTIDAIRSGEIKEISAGYRAQVDWVPGITPTGERYDGVQSDVRFNHVALGPVGWARAGRMAALQT